ncbi:TetR/AcrR family transcriptional regulator [Methylopila musalis]|uniref:TetR/AcrR family transcriptional regulator n=1 Tax=Methylopila musalis TaxID=1134781 RepID=A0ABW3ZBK8_9HYPH
MTVTHLASVARKRAPRLAGDARRAQIVTAACSFFADNGFSGPTRDLAASIGVTQALLYRYFESKTDLIEAVFVEAFRSHWSEGALEAFAASAGEPMVDRVSQVYAGMIGRMTATTTRLLFRAGLDSYAEPVERNLARSWPVWTALLDQWRAEEGVPPLSERPLLEGERTLMHAFHNAMLTIRVRAFVFGFAPTLDDAEEIRQVAETHDAGVRSVLRILHSGAVTTPRALPAIDGSLVAA